MASRRVLGSLVGRAVRSPSPANSHAEAATTVCRAAFASAVNNGDPAPETGSEEDKQRRSTAATGDAGDGGPVGHAVADVGRKAKGAAEEVKEAGRHVKNQAMEVGEDVKEAIKETH